MLLESDHSRLSDQFEAMFTPEYWEKRSEDARAHVASSFPNMSAGFRQGMIEALSQKPAYLEAFPNEALRDWFFEVANEAAADAASLSLHRLWL